MGQEPARGSASSGVFSSLSVRNYRLFASGQLVSLVGTWMQTTAQAWLILQLGGGGLGLGCGLALQFGPSLLLTLPAGVLADRVDRRRLLVATQSVAGALALVLGLLTLTGAITLAQVLTFALLFGLVSAVDIPVRQSFVSEMVGPDKLTNAVALNSVTFNTARIIGPAVAGLLIAGVGSGWVFLGNAVSYLAVIAGLVMMRPEELYLSTRVARARGQLREGLSYVRRRGDLMLPIGIIFVVGTFGINFPITLSLMAKEQFGGGAGSYGLLSSAVAVGSLLGAVFAAKRTRPRQRLVLGAAFAFGVLELAAGLMPTIWLLGLMLIPMGAAVLTCTTAANATVQLGSDPQVRGRVMSLYVLVFLGGTPIGAPLIGWLSEVFGPRAGLVFGGAVCALAALAAAAVLSRRQHHQAAVHGPVDHPEPEPTPA